MDNSNQMGKCDILEGCEDELYEDLLSEQQDGIFTEDYEIGAGPSSQASLSNHNIKEMEEKFQALRKENFSLKFRIYFLEERLEMCNLTPDQQENLVKKNKSLQEAVKNLSRELEDSKTLLCAAARALDESDEKCAEREIELRKKLEELQTDLEREFGIAPEVIPSKESSSSYCRSGDMQPEENALNQINKLRTENNDFFGVIKNCFRKVKQKFHAKVKDGEDRIAELKMQIQHIGMLEKQLTSVSQDCGEISDMLKTKCHKIIQLDNELSKLKSSVAHGDCKTQTTVDISRKHKDVEKLREIAVLLESLHAHKSTTENKDKKIMKQLLEEILKLGNGGRKIDSSCVRMLESFCSSEDADSLDDCTEDTDTLDEVLEKVMGNPFGEDTVNYSEVVRRWNENNLSKLDSTDNTQLSLLEYTRMMEDRSVDEISENLNNFKDRNPLQTQSMCVCGRNHSIPDARICRSADRFEENCNDIVRKKLKGVVKEDLLRRLKDSHSKIKRLSKVKDSAEKKESQICCALMSFILSYTHFLLKH